MQQLDRVVDGQLAPECARVRGDLQRAARVARGHDLRAGVQQVSRLARAQLGRGLGLDEVVDAGRAAAQLPLRRLAHLERRFGERRRELLQRRRERRERFEAGELLDFLPETRAIREGDWRVAPPPEAYADRRVEITGPVDRKMIINALNSGARGFMADFEDSLSPTWSNVADGHVNLIDAIEATIEFTAPDGREYRLGEQTATLLVRPRGWHLDDKHVIVDGRAITGAFLDFGLYAFHNARRLLAKGSGPFFYLPKMESHLEARLWNDVFSHTEDTLGLDRGAIRATVLIETLPAAFEMDEILYELRDHAAGTP